MALFLYIQSEGGGREGEQGKRGEGGVEILMISYRHRLLLVPCQSRQAEPSGFGKVLHFPGLGSIWAARRASLPSPGPL